MKYAFAGRAGAVVPVWFQRGSALCWPSKRRGSGLVPTGAAWASRQPGRVRAELPEDACGLFVATSPRN